MKRMIKSATMDELAEVVADVTSTVEKYFEEFEGLSKEESKEYYRVEVDDFDTGNDSDRVKKITLYAEMGYEDFSYIANELSKSVQSIDPDSYFDVEDTGVFSAFVNLNYKPKEQDSIFNNKNIDPVVDMVCRQVSKALDEDFEVEECYISDPYYSVNGSPDEDHVRIYVTIESDSHESLAYVDFFKSDVVSLQQVKMDLTDELYSKLINNVVNKE